MLKCSRHMGLHDDNVEKGAEKVPGLSTINGTIVYKDYGVESSQQEPSKNDEEEDYDNDEEGEEKLDFCCLSGCLTMISVGILIFLALPAGILICTYASSNNDDELLIVGIVLAVSPVVSFPLIALILFNRRRITKLRKRKVSIATMATSTTETTTLQCNKY